MSPLRILCQPLTYIQPGFTRDIFVLKSWIPVPVRSSPVPAPLPGLSSFFPPPPVVSCIYEGRNVGQNVCGSYGPNKCSRPRTRDSQTGERRERERENRGRNFSDLFFIPGSRSQLSFLPDFPCLETFNPLTFYLGEEFDNFSSRYIFRGYIYIYLFFSLVPRN